MSDEQVQSLAKCAWVRNQTMMARDGSVVLRNGSVIPVWCAFRCLYCGEYFNQAGAEEHFGKTRIEYNEDRPEVQRVEVSEKALDVIHDVLMQRSSDA